MALIRKQKKASFGNKNYHQNHFTFRKKKEGISKE